MDFVAFASEGHFLNDMNQSGRHPTIIQMAWTKLGGEVFKLVAPDAHIPERGLEEFMIIESKWRRLTLLIGLFLLAGCASIPVEERDKVREEVDRGAREIIEKVISKKPEVRELIDSSAGYFAGRPSGATAAVFGFSSGLGVLVDKENQTRTYMDIERFDLGVGVGMRSYSVLSVIEDAEILESIAGGINSAGISAETSVGEGGVTMMTTTVGGVTTYIVPDTGASASTSVHWASLSINDDLTDSAVSEISIPNKGFDQPGKQRKAAPRKWARFLPFLAQKVIDEGYDLPLPLGIGLTFSRVESFNALRDIEVGLNGNPKEPFEFVVFEDSPSSVDTWQVKADVWLFPFLNVFGLIGTVRGDAQVDVVLDGNDMLDNLGVDCSRPRPNPRCRLLEDRLIELPTIDAEIRGMTYGVGGTLAGGWRNWFVAIPISFSWLDIDAINPGADKDTDGFAFTITPRGGRVFNLGNAGNLGVFTGANYLNSQFKITGREVAPELDLVIDYTLDQENVDKWNIVLGANWDITKHWALSVEYNGFIGSREAFISSLSYRF